MALKHLTKEEIIKYAAGAFAGAERTRVKKHLAECDTCGMKEIHVAAIKSAGPCVKARALFAQYAAHQLGGKETAFVRDHIAVCDACFEAYDRLIEPYADTAEFKAAAKETAREITANLGKFDVSRYLVKDKGSVSLDRKKAFEISKNGVTLSIKDDAKGKLKTYLKSDKFNVSDVKVSIGRQEKASFIPALSGTTTKRGIANMETSKNAMPSAGVGEYAVVLTGLTKRTKK